MFKDVLKDFITTSQPTRQDAQGRIDYGVAAGKLTPEEAAELEAMLVGNTTLMDMQASFLALSERVAALEAERRDPALPDDVQDWVPPTGAHDAPNTGDKLRHNGIIYVSKINGNTTVPGSDPRYWEVATQ